MEELKKALREASKEAMDNHYAMVEPFILDLDKVVCICNKYIKDNFISKLRIQEIIIERESEKLKTLQLENIITGLKSLLESAENNKLQGKV